MKKPTPDPAYTTAHDTDDGWRVTLSVRVHHGQPVIEAATINRVPSFELPQNGLTAEAFRKLPYGRIAESAKALLPTEIESKAVDEWQHAIRTALDAEPIPSGRQGYSNAFYAAIAAAFVLAIWQGSKAPGVEVARFTGKEPRTVAKWLRLARSDDKQLLTAAPPGKAGGQLTAEAKAMLNLTHDLP